MDRAGFARGINKLAVAAKPMASQFSPEKVRQKFAGGASE